MKNISNSLNEKDVENAYRSEFSKISGSTITSPYGVDGLLSSNKIYTLLEFKYNTDLKNKLSQSIVLIQCLYYLKKFEENGVKLPTTIFVADQNECFIIHTNSIVKYLSSDINWKIAPSEAHKKNPELLQEIVNDENILPFVHDVDDDFNISIIVDKINDLSDNITRKIRLTKHNVVNIFDYFIKNGLKENQLTTNEKANLFIQLIINPAENYIHPKKKNILVSKSFGDVSVDQNLIKSFFTHFEGDIYSPKEKELLTGLVDRLVEDTTRRSKGEFFTPTPFVDLAHNYIGNTFGEDWKDRFVVWDCAWGTGNLTRDYNFNELYCSTLEQSDIDTANQMGYNMEATKFQFDFLNDSDDKLPKGLKDVIDSGREVLFLINPPYATAANGGSKEDNTKKDVSFTNVRELMHSEGYGDSVRQLYSQFLYKIQQFNKINKNIKIGIFSPPLFLSGVFFKQFRELFLKDFKYSTGFLFEAKHFSDVAKGWGISFTIFESGVNQNDNYLLDVVDYNDVFEFIKVDDKIVYNCDKIDSALNNCKIELKSLNTLESIQVKNAISVGGSNKVTIVENNIGYFDCASNNVYQNNQRVGLYSTAFSNRGGLSIIKENFHKVTNLFTARKTIQPTWINCKDEYLAPNEDHPRYEQFTYDSIVYSLFNNSSQQSSLRKVDYKDKKWDIKNEFFWLSKNDMLRLSEENNYDEIYKDAKTSSERFVYSKLFGEERIYDKLSPIAKEVLDMATELTYKSFKMRKLVSENNPDFHLDSWDAGYAQLKLVWKDYFKDEFNLFRSKYKELEDSLRPLVYELGFLRS